MKMKINLGISKKRYSRDMSFDNNTTFGFGDVQPVMCQMMLPDSDININAKQLVRLSPLIAPSFARVKLFTTARFVPMTEVYEPFESFLSNIAFTSPSGSTFIPSRLPNLPQNLLFLSLLPYCQWSVSSKIHPASTAELTSDATKALHIMFMGFYSASYLKYGFNPSYNLTGITEESADYILSVPDFREKDNTATICIRLTNTGRRLRKIFIGLGYEVLSMGALQIGLNVSILPLLAFYKAYFDTYFPQRDISFLQTKCYSFISYLSRLSNPSFVAFTTSEKNLFADIFFSFVHSELSNCLYTAFDDYISIHTSNPTNNLTDTFLTVRGNDAYKLNEPVGNLPSVSSSTLDNVLLKSLKVFTNFVAKDSVIGQRMSLWVRNHFNADVSNQLFKETNFVGSNSLDLQINDVFSTSDTADISNKTGEHLGAYAGKGIGFGSSNFHFHSPVHGYLIVFACIAPESRTFQGTDATLLNLSRYSLPQPEFDALGYEVTDSRVFFGSNDLYIGAPSNRGFGFVPRYTGYKYRKNICNGSMSLRSVAHTLEPYYLDRIIIKNYAYQRLSASPIELISNDLPTASTEWRYITKYPWLSNFNRLFIKDVTEDDSTVGDIETNIQEDNFICQIAFNVSLKDALKPLKQSYDTFDEERDTDTTSVNAE